MHKRHEKNLSTDIFKEYYKIHQGKRTLRSTSYPIKHSEKLILHTIHRCEPSPYIKQRETP